MYDNIFEFKLLVKKGDSIEKSVYEFLRRAVFAGYFQPGERLIESKLAQRLNVSRTPLREALKRLEAEGLVHIIPNRGATVVKTSPEEIEERYFVVGVVEGLVAYFAMDNIKKEDIERMKEIEAILEDEKCQKDFMRWLQLDDNFHNIFISASKKPLLVRTLEQTKRPLARYWYLACTSPGMAESCISGHSNILQAFSERNSEKVRRAAEIHYFEIGRLMKKHLTRISLD